jgi:protoheme IX farnesyltransferase
VKAVLELSKPRITQLVVLTAAGGYYMASRGPFAPGRFAWTLLGTALVAAGTNALNQLRERDTDALMRRTRMRPLPDGRVAPSDAHLFGWLLAAAGLGVLLLLNRLAAGLALVTLVSYLAFYTPLKRRSPVSTLVGAVPGALPPVIGWTAAHGTLSAGGWVLFALVFCWQIPHFLAIAWMFREDYRNAGLPMLPVLEPEGRQTGRLALLATVALLAVSLLPSVVGITGWRYAAAAIVLGAALLALAVRFARRRSDGAARALFYGSISYLPLVWAAMILDH